MTAAGIGRFSRSPLPSDLPARGAFVVVSNHPTLVDVLFLLGTIPGVCCVVHRRLFGSFFIGPTLRYGDHIRGPDPEDPEASVLDAIVQRLQEGTPVLIFPEGTRSPVGSLQRFKRGAVEAAIRAEVPLVPVFLWCDPPTLTKGGRGWRAPERAFHMTMQFLPVMEPAHVGGDSRSITREFKERYTELVAEARSGGVGDLAEGAA
jgi:1-acyl-sn-glycerol-3-phosphate acyltransferase